jgi:hypothetical protein
VASYAAVGATTSSLLGVPPLAMCSAQNSSEEMVAAHGAEAEEGFDRQPQQHLRHHLVR